MSVRTRPAYPRVIIASRIFSPEPAAAAYRLEAVTEAFLAARARVRVLTSKWSAGDTALRQPYRNGSCLKVSRWPVMRDAAGAVRGYLPYMSFDLPLAFRLAVARPADVVLVEPPPTTGAVVRVVMGLKRTPYVWYAADVWSDAAAAAGAPKLVVTVLRAVERFAVSGAAGSVAVSEGVAQRVRALGGRNVKVVPNGIDVGTYNLEAQRFSDQQLAAWGITRPYLLYAGTASEWQGAEVFAHAMEHLAAQHPQLQLVFVGQGARWQQIQDQAARINKAYGRQVIVQLPVMDAGDVARMLSGSRLALVSLVPGRGYDFAYPTKVLAALGTGTPVLYAGVGEVTRDLEQGDLGRATEYDPVAVAKEIGSMLRQEDPPWQAAKLHSWVLRNRTQTATARTVADFVLAQISSHTGRRAGRTPGAGSGAVEDENVGAARH